MLLLSGLCRRFEAITFASELIPTANLQRVLVSNFLYFQPGSLPLAFALFEECLNGPDVLAIVLIATAGPFLVDELNREFLVLIHTIIFTQKSVVNYLHFNSLGNVKGIKPQTA